MHKIVVEIPEGWGVILLVKKWKFRGGGGAYVKFPPWWGYGYFLELHNNNYHTLPFTLSFLTLFMIATLVIAISLRQTSLALCLIDKSSRPQSNFTLNVAVINISLCNRK